TAWKALSVLIPACAAAVLLLAEGAGTDAGAEARVRRARARFLALDAGLERSLVRSVLAPGAAGARGVAPGERAAWFDRLEALRPSFPPGAFLELVGDDGAPAAWAGEPPAEARDALLPREALAGAVRGGLQPMVLPAGPFLWLGRAEAVPGSSPPLLLAAWVRLDVVDPAFLGYFPEPTVAKELSGDRPGSVRILPPRARPDPADGASARAVPLPGPASTDGGLAPPVLLVSGEPGHAGDRRPGPAASLAGGLAVLLALLWAGLGAVRSAARPAPLRFLALLALLALAFAGLRAFDFPGRWIGGPAFDPSGLRPAGFPGAPASPGDFLTAVLFLTGAAAAFVSLVPPALHRLAERSRLAAAAQAASFPFAAPLLGFGLAEALRALSALHAADLFPSGRILLPLPGTLLLLGLFLLGLDFVLVGATLLHVNYRALLPYAGRKAPVLAVLGAAAATALAFAPSVPLGTAWAPAAVLLLLHPVHLTLRKEGLTALHAGTFLLAAAAAVFPGLRDEARRLKREEVERVAEAAANARRDLPARLEKAVRAAGGPWRGSLPKDSPLLAFLLWARSGLDLPGLSVRVEVKDPAADRACEYRAGPAPEWPVEEPAFIRSYLNPRPGALEPITAKGAPGTLGQARSPEGFQVTFLAFWDWPAEMPPCPSPASLGPALAFGWYEGGHLRRSSRGGPSPGTPLPSKAAAAAREPVWTREEYPWGPADVLYRPAGAPGAVLSAAAPAPAFWGETLAFLRLFLAGLLFAVAAAGSAAAARGVRRGSLGFPRRMKYRLAASFALLSVVPLFLLAFYMERGGAERLRSAMTDRARLELDMVSEMIREEVEILDQFKKSEDPAPGVTAEKVRKVVDSADLRRKAAALGIEWDLFLFPPEAALPSLPFSSRQEAMDAQVVPSRLPGPAYRSLVLGGEVYGFDLSTRGDGLVLQGWKRLLDRDLGTAALLATTRVVPGWTVEADIARGVSITLSLYLLSVVAVGFVGLVLARRIALPLEQLTE
ncbi:MAG: hypothetical protein MUC63_08375, partial [Planctomycetes bacterium]|nr:hypothetical protein [Planctomycetota bacterium]